MDEVLIGDPLEFSNKIDRLIQDGPNALHVVTDFDLTLTKLRHEGNSVQSTFGQLRAKNHLSMEYEFHSRALFEAYHPFETDPNLFFEDKLEKMKQWWTSEVELMKKHGLTRDIVKKVGQSKTLFYRDHALSFITDLSSKNIPTIILSAGLGDIIRESLHDHDGLTPKIHLVANFFDYDEKGKVTGFRNELIHSLNKNESHLRQSLYWEKIMDRKNAILIGDRLSDLQMTQGMPHGEILRIGFLNENIERDLARFEESFDMVILNDGSFEPVKKLVEQIDKRLH